MPINYDIYGQPETWHNCYYGGGSTQPWTIPVHAEKAKVPTWALIDETPTFVNSQLRTAVEDNKLTPREPIDNSICAVGQGRRSPFRKFAVYSNCETSQATNGEIIQIGHAYTGANLNDNNSPVNTFWFEAYSSSSAGIYGNGAFSNGRLVIRDGANIVQGLDQRIWSPTGENSHGTNKQNGNFYIAPFMSYGSRTYVLQIWVYVTSADYDSGYSGNTPNGGWKTLDDWKTNFPTKAITGCLLRVRAASQYDASTGNISYYGVNYGSSDYRKVSCGILDTMKFELDDGTTLPDLCAYGLFTNGSNSDVGIALFNGLSNVYKWSDTLQQIAIVPEFISQYIKTYESSMFPYIPYSDEIYDYIMESCACFGMAFTPAKGRGSDSSNCRFNQSFTDVDLCLPIIDDNGIAHGDYTRGADNVNNDFIDLSSQWEKNYTPSAPIDTNTYSITTGFNTVGNVASTTKQYVINANALQGLSGELWSVVGDLITNPDDLKNLDNLLLDTFLTSNPIDAIVSVKKFPLSSVPHGENLENIYLGKYQTSAAGYTLALQQARYNFEGIPIFPKFGNCFLDYSPYTKMQLYVPFCGTIDIDAADFMGRTLSVEMVIDFITGSVTAYVLANQLVVTSLTGTCAIDIPITGTEQATVNSAYESATIAERQARKNEIMQTVGIFTHPIKTATKPLTTAAERVSTALDRAQREYELTHINMPLRQIGQASPLNSWALEFVCRLIIYYPDGECISFNATNEPSLISDKVQAFGAVSGFATVETDTLNKFTGFTQVSDADLTGISATDTEKEMIINLLQSGVYL